MSQSPRAFRLDRPDVVTRLADEPLSEASPSGIVVTEEPMDAVVAADGVPVLPKPRRRMPWLGLFVSAAGSLAGLAVTIGFERFVAGLFESEPWLGWLATGLAAVALLALAGFVLREIVTTK